MTTGTMQLERHTPDSLRATARRIMAAGEALRAMHFDDVVRGLAQATKQLQMPETMLGQEAAALLPGSTGLSPEMVRWGLHASLHRVTEASLFELGRSPTPPTNGAVLTRARLAVTVLSANVFTACVEPILCALLARVPLVVKASSRDDVFPRLLALALRDAHPALGDAFEVVTFPGGDTALEDALFAEADVVSVYGHDATIQSVRGRITATTVFVAHGTGMGALYVANSALGSASDAAHTAALIAEDVIAYDQRGCLSPHVVFAQGDAGVSPRDFAEILSRDGIAEAARRLPRGPLPTADAAAQMQWRGVAVTRGELFEGSTHAVSYEQQGPLRLSPGYRNISVIAVRDLDEVITRMQPLGAHWKALGMATHPTALREAHLKLPPPLCPRISPAGQMQSPPLDAISDGSSRWDGLIRWIA